MARFADALLLLVASFGALAAAQDDGLPRPFSAHYELLRDGDAIGEASIAFEAMSEDRLRLRTRTRGTRGIAGIAGAELNEESEFHWAAGLPELDSYRYEQQVAWSSKQRSLDADRERGRIVGTDRDREFVLEWVPGVIDRHTVLLAMAADLEARERSTARALSDRLRYRVADKSRVEWHTYRVAGRERISTPAGAYDTQRIERVREKPGRTTTSWLARDAGTWIPVRIVQREPEGETIELRLVSLTR